MSRIRAFGIHLAISLAIFVVLAWLVVYVWYPDFFFATDGGWEGMRIIVFVDLVLGPMLTLVVYKAGKPGLRRDLTMIGTFQMLCLVAGTYIVYAERPIALVYVDGIFFSMSSDDYASPPDLEAIPGPYPKKVFVDIPADPVAQSKLRSEARAQGISIRAMTDKYRPLREIPPHLVEPFPEPILRAKDQGHGYIAQWQADHGESLSDYAFFPFGTRYSFMFLGVSRATGDIEGVLNTPAVLAEAEARKS